MAKLLFKNEGLRKILLHLANNKGKKYRRSFGYAVAAWEKETGRKFKFDQKIPDSYYESDKPVFFLVKDDGIYLMSSAKGEVPKDESHVCYAVHYGPGPDTYDRCRAAVGGDDFVEDIEVTSDIITYIKCGFDLEIEITENHYSVKATAPKIKKSTKQMLELFLEANQ